MPVVSPTAHSTVQSASIEWSRELSQIWERQQARVWERIETIGDALDALADGGLDPELRLEAVRAAHMLAGSLGVFGLHDASEAARRIELGLAGVSAPVDAPALARQLGRLRDRVRDGTAAETVYQRTHG